MDTRAIETPAAIETSSHLAEDLPTGGRPIQGIAIGTILSVLLWAGLIMSGAALIR
jgi:hypothetical protein